MIRNQIENIDAIERAYKNNIKSPKKLNRLINFFIKYNNKPKTLDEINDMLKDKYKSPIRIIDFQQNNAYHCKYKIIESYKTSYRLIDNVYTYFKLTYSDLSDSDLSDSDLSDSDLSDSDLSDSDLSDSDLSDSDLSDSDVKVENKSDVFINEIYETEEDRIWNKLNNDMLNMTVVQLDEVIKQLKSALLKIPKINIPYINRIRKYIDVIKDAKPVNQRVNNDIYVAGDLNTIIIQPEHRMRQIVGDVQSGKSAQIIKIANFYHTKGISVVIAVRNMEADSIQLKNRFNGYKPITEKFNENMITSAFSGQTNHIFIVIRNSRFKHFSEALNKMAKHQFVLIVDESDFVDSGSEKAICQSYIKVVKDNAKVVWNVSATPITTLIGESIIVENVFNLTTQRNYKGIKDFCIEYLEYPAYRICRNVEDSLETYDDNLLPYMNRIVNMKPFYEYKHPIISLIVNCTVINPVHRFVNSIEESFGDKVVLIRFNGGADGMDVRCKGLHSSVKHWLNSCFNNNISGLLGWLQNNGGVEKFTHIYIFSGRLADRGISFSTSPEHCKVGDFRWHLTHQYLLFAESGGQDNGIQNCRLCGNFDDDIELTLSIYDQNKNLHKSFKSQKEIITRGVKSDRNKLISEAMYEVVMHRHKLPTNVVNNRVRRLPCTPTTGEDGGESLESYGINIQEDDNSINLSKIKIAYNKQSVNGRGMLFKLITYFCECNNVLQTKKSIETHTKSTFIINHFNRYEAGRHAYYNLIACVGNKYNMHADIYDYFKNM